MELTRPGAMSKCADAAVPPPNPVSAMAMVCVYNATLGGAAMYLEQV